VADGNQSAPGDVEADDREAGRLLGHGGCQADVSEADDGDGEMSGVCRRASDGFGTVERGQLSALGEVG
jgi:hypothetical protein